MMTKANNIIFIGGLNWDMDAMQLEEAFRSYGPILDAWIVKERHTERSRGFGFVVFYHQGDAIKAIEDMDGAWLQGRQIRVAAADERKQGKKSAHFIA